MIRVLFTLFIIFCISYGFLFLHHLVLARYKFKFDESALLMFFGLPGSGKSTVCAEIVRQLTSAWKDFKNRISIFCNFPVRGANRLDRSMIGSVDFCGENDRALLLLDEASTVYFKRNAMQKGKDGKLQFSDAENQFHSMHRHYHTMEVCFAQSWDGVDIRLRELSTGLFYVEKSRIRGFIKIRKIGKIFTINEDHQPIDGYDFVKWSSRYVWAPRSWKLFDTYNAPVLPAVVPDPWYKSDVVDDG